MKLVQVFLLLVAVIVSGTFATAKTNQHEYYQNSFEIVTYSFVNSAKDWFKEQGHVISKFFDDVSVSIVTAKNGFVDSIKHKVAKLKEIKNRLTDGIKQIGQALKKAYLEYVKGTNELTEILDNLEKEVDQSFQTTLDDITKIIFDNSKDIEKFSKHLITLVEQLPAENSENNECHKIAFETEIHHFAQASHEQAISCSAQAKDNIVQAYENAKSYVGKIFEVIKSSAIKVLSCIFSKDSCKAILSEALLHVKQYLGSVQSFSIKLYSLSHDIFKSLKCLDASGTDVEQKKYVLVKQINSCLKK